MTTPTEYSMPACCKREMRGVPNRHILVSAIVTQTINRDAARAVMIEIVSSHGIVPAPVGFNSLFVMNVPLEQANATLNLGCSVEHGILYECIILQLVVPAIFEIPLSY